MSQELMTRPESDAHRWDDSGDLPPPQNLLGGLWRSMRPKQWLKNGFLFAGLLFTLDHRHPPQDLFRTLAGFVLFCLLSSSVYLINDLVDRPHDRLHPRKRHRPIATGLVPPPLAAGCAAFCRSFPWLARSL